jgi:hypothetical protein
MGRTQELTRRELIGAGTVAHVIHTHLGQRRSAGVLIDSTQLFNDKLAKWQDFCNSHRPHGSLGGQDTLRAPPAEDHHDHGPPSKRSTSAAHTRSRDTLRSRPRQYRDSLDVRPISFT